MNKPTKIFLLGILVTILVLAISYFYVKHLESKLSQLEYECEHEESKTNTDPLGLFPENAKNPEVTSEHADDSDLWVSVPICNAKDLISLDGLNGV